MTPAQLQQRRRTHRPFEMDVKLSLRQLLDKPHFVGAELSPFAIKNGHDAAPATGAAAQPPTRSSPAAWRSRSAPEPERSMGRHRMTRVESPPPQPRSSENGKTRRHRQNRIVQSQPAESSFQSMA